MKNLTMCSKEFIRRVYDIKGSMNNRSVLNQKKIKEGEEEKLRGVTLKDKDFRVLEDKVWISTREVETVKDILNRDIDFLGRIGVMDYSVLIIKR